MLGKKALEALSPLLESGTVNDNGEMYMFCPYHGDSARSASISIETGLWNCQACGESGQARALIADRENWVIEERRHEYTPSGKKTARKFELSEAEVEGWHSGLMTNKQALSDLMTRRGLSQKIIKRYQIGWDSTYKAYTIPIRDAYGEIINIRFYKLDPQEGRRKIWSVAGHGEPQLYPIDQLERGKLVICEGEWDALLSIQKGVPAITRTSTADAWHPRWNVLFQNKDVVVCHDMDNKGQRANDKVSQAVRSAARSVSFALLPYEVTAKHGKDLTDFWMEGHTREEFWELVEEVVVADENQFDPYETTPMAATVRDTFRASLHGRPLRVPVTVAGVSTAPYTLPCRAVVQCGVDQEAKCRSCSVSGAKNPGSMEITVEASDPLTLSMLDVTTDKVNEVMLKTSGVNTKCKAFNLEVLEYRRVEELYVRPSIETESDGQMQQDFTYRKVILAADADLSNNMNVDLHGSVFANPKNQHNEFLVWDVEKPESIFDTFAVTDEVVAKLKKFQTDEPLKMMRRIAKDMAPHVTELFGRDDMHVFMDIVFHSPLYIQLTAEESVVKGWVDGMIIGDTRTGKSQMASRLIREYGVGELVSCEAASFAGVVGGLERTNEGKWYVKWGVIPMHDKRLVAMDELSGLSLEQISLMSDLRSSGQVTLTKIESQRAHARTRLLWLGNPREGSMDDFRFAVDALKQLIGRDEDIARFDMAMGAFKNDVDPAVINQLRSTGNQRRKFDKTSLRLCLFWAWTRTHEQVKFEPEAVQDIMRLSVEMGNTYESSPPLVQGENFRFKLARIAAAMALRTFSTDDDPEVCVVRPVHVRDAVEFLGVIYDNDRFGYRKRSKAVQEIKEFIDDNEDDIMNYLCSVPNLLDFLRDNPTFSESSLRAMAGASAEGAANIIGRLSTLKLVEVYDRSQYKLRNYMLRRMG